MFIPDPNFFRPGSRIRIKEFQYFSPKKWFLSSRKWSVLFIRDPDPGSRSRIWNPYPEPGSWFFTHSGTRSQKATGSRIRIRNTGPDFPLPWQVRSTVRWKGWEHHSCCPAPALRCTWIPRGQQSNRRVYNVVFYSKNLKTLLNFNAKKTDNYVYLWVMTEIFHETNGRDALQVFQTLSQLIWWRLLNVGFIWAKQRTHLFEEIYAEALVSVVATEHLSLQGWLNHSTINRWLSILFLLFR